MVPYWVHRFHGPLLLRERERKREREREREREVCFHMFFSNIGGFKGCPKRATRQFRSPIETACRANRKAHGGTMAKPAGCFESCCGRLCGAEAFESCCDAFEGFKDCLERATRQFRSPIETAFWANREAPWQHQQHTSRAAAEGCAVLRPSKAAARLLRVLRPAQNVPRGSFEAQ